MSLSGEQTLSREVDPFTVEILRAGIIATTQEMKVNLMRTSYNSIVYEAEDFTVAMTDRHGNLASIGLGLPSFIRGISDTTKAMLEFFGGDIYPGDILLTNDPQYHGSHLNHVIMALPVFVDGEIVAFTCSEPHWASIGGVLMGTFWPTDRYTEGLCIPPVKIYKKGELNKEITAMIQANVRNPDLAMGDFRGQVACVRTGEKRVVHMAKKYGKGVFMKAIEIIMAQSDEYSRSQLLKIPDGHYEASQFMDDDGIDLGKHMNMKVKITKKDDTMTVDLTEVDPPGRGPFNSGAALSGAQMGFKTLICPTWYPVNDGSFRPLKVITKPGTFVTATEGDNKNPPIVMWMNPPMNIADTMWHAMAQAMPDRVSAGHFATLGGGAAGGAPINPKTGRPVALRRPLGGNGGGGWGAKYNSDGNCAIFCLNDGDTHNTPIESGEAHNYKTAMVTKMELRQDSAGAGKFRGGVGTMSEVVHFVESATNSMLERCISPPWGIFGGKSGLANGFARGVPTTPLEAGTEGTSKVLEVPLKWEVFPNPSHPNGKLAGRVVPAGSRSQGWSGGGGGFGDPLEREVWRVEDDVRNGYVSVAAAREHYGVVMDPGTMKADEAETEKLRGSRSKGSGA